jgi:prepilin-type N-terminal cleavage/methylation domain-containing protein
MNFIKSTSHGFTLIEVLISLLLSSTAILCFYTLQIKDRQLFIDNLIQNEAQMQVLNIRELILADPYNAGFNSQKILALTATNEACKTAIQQASSFQFLLQSKWMNHLEQDVAAENFFNLLILI